ncbi:heparan-alpha-glucosaminide N-acetyltransferase isoform X1 [Osmia lignaria lignaria]|uniref:heparan-alpha-glucosaminide N-acetyltransferase isoform X1 n=1 Tax=Osmia lignaria lignaria TaxID=1437193 RepID=UPI0014784156|nr:heparan-alpha-glucosaminide N-acetyltransferase-like isoform X1 [Osmia lignaria]XP_034191244.1 heparan-alpha-glucosaminide N-acetyltransferase-like isoform X1 [Osmia lignaria]XP_034191245.1 heparan-alpha-glucosaminide N-acetyltransferase-like isoform X1 [Osmia lignaria]XP_034191246.1 heparan-alpha-glucosaminide N-acetyltransferase-like isoform X1 [Osmia lignaria]XP_034191247.1 heparan-alpha-glucosaminide N-acetyltransferase-like isoform X1 [Osmia lignaria]XP_034191248.1 heparan-alpha-glucos
MTSNILNPCNNTNVTLGIDEACLNILNLYYYPVICYSIAWDAYWGTGMRMASLAPSTEINLVISTKYPLHIYYAAIESARVYEYCHTTYTFKEHGSYRWKLVGPQCPEIEIKREPSESYLPIFAAFMVYTLLAIIWTTSKVIIRVIRGRLSPENVQDDLVRLQEAESTTHPVIRTTKASTRIRSVDTFRGICILLMIFVNNGGGKYVFFNHSTWFGLTVADLVLPWFAWIMGLTITISKRAELRVTASRLKITLRCVRRSLILIFLGLILNSTNLIQKIQLKSLSDLRFPGVLQLLAVSYFVCSTLETIFMKPHSQDTLLQFGRFASFRDILDSWPQWLIMAGIVTTHTLITFLLPVPGCPKGYFGPGGKYDHRGKYVNCTAGAAGYIDRTIFGNHTYSKTMDPMYGQISRYDPEGLMNTISAIFIVYLGVHAGKILLMYYQYNGRVIRWFLWAVLTGIIAGILCGFSKFNGVIPVSKKMMTLSFDLTCSSFAFLLYAILYTLVDYKQVWGGAPFIYAGTNPIFLYVGHILTKDLFPWSWPIPWPSHASLLAMNLWTTTVWAIVGYLLYRKDIIMTI